MINKKDYKHILESELQSLKINVTKFKKDIDTVNFPQVARKKGNGYQKGYTAKKSALSV